MLLKTISKEKRLQIDTGCVQFFLGYNKHTKFIGVHNKLTKLFTDRYTTEVWLMITCCSKAIKKGTTLSKFSLNKNHYSQNNKEYGFNLSVTRTKQLLGLLEEQDYLKVYKGYWTTKKAETTIIEFLPKFTSIFEGIDLDFIKVTSDKSPVEIRALHTKTPMSNKGFRGVSLFKREVENYNTLLGNTDITLFGDPCIVEYQRIFIEDLHGSGRWYCAGFQTIKSELRQYITFDGECSTELDIKAIHPSMYACLLGVTLPDGYDPYSCSLPLIGCALDIRKLCKQGLLCILYASSRKSAKLALANHYKEDSILPCEERDYKSIVKYKGIFSEIIDDLIKTNHLISERFFKEDGWLEMQNLDSSLCRHIINEFVNRGKPILSYHDSWVIPLSDSKLLEDTIKAAWLKVLGTKENLAIDVKF